MVPFNFTEFIDDLTFQVKNNIIPISRIDDAVARILRVKFTMGLFENPIADLSLANQNQTMWQTKSINTKLSS
jgi:beta-glucosidase-like glycosyl hydrolase